MDGAGGEATVLGSAGGVAPLFERLQRRDQERLQEAERRRLEKAGATVEEEKRGFLAVFSPERESLERLLQDEAIAGPEEGAQAGLQAAVDRLHVLQKLLNDSVRFLPSYDVKQAQEALQRLHMALGERRERLQPKKKFAFKARERKDSPAAPPSAAAEAPVASVRTQEPDYICGFRGLEAQSLELSGAELQGKDVQLSDLRGCRVRLLGSLGTLHLRGLQGCTVLSGPVSSSVFVDECSRSELAFACQQLRMHRSSDNRIYLHVTSRAIIEDCSGLAFAPLTWVYPGMDEDLRRAGLNPARNHWSQVDDFDWLARDAASPNWSILPEEQRRTLWD